MRAIISGYNFPTVDDAAENIIAGAEEVLQGDELRSAENLVETMIDMLCNLMEAADIEWDDLCDNPTAAKRLAQQLAK